MKLDIPFYKQTTNLNCGPAALRMVLAFLDKDHGLERLEEAVGLKLGKGTSTIKLAIAASEMGYSARLFSTSLFFREEHMESEYYKEYADMTLEVSREMVEKARTMGVGLEERSLHLGELLRFVTRDCVVIILLNWNVVLGRDKGYYGHFVPIVGYDNKSVYVHNQGQGNPTESMAIPREVFDDARKAKGTDEDFVVVCRK